MIKHGMLAPPPPNPVWWKVKSSSIPGMPILPGTKTVMGSSNTFLKGEPRTSWRRSSHHLCNPDRQRSWNPDRRARTPNRYVGFCQAKDLMDNWYAKHGDAIEYVIANNDAMALGAIASLKANGFFGTGGKFMPVVGVDAIPDALAAIKNGELVGFCPQRRCQSGSRHLPVNLNVALEWPSGWNHMDLWSEQVSSCSLRWHHPCQHQDCWRQLRWIRSTKQKDALLVSASFFE